MLLAQVETDRYRSNDHTAVYQFMLDLPKQSEVLEPQEYEDQLLFAIELACHSSRARCEPMQEENVQGPPSTVSPISSHCGVAPLNRLFMLDWLLAKNLVSPISSVIISKNSLGKVPEQTPAGELCCRIFRWR